MTTLTTESTALTFLRGCQWTFAYTMTQVDKSGYGQSFSDPINNWVSVQILPGPCLNI